MEDIKQNDEILGQLDQTISDERRLNQKDISDRLMYVIELLNQQNYTQVDNLAGFISLYTKEVLDKLVDCYIEWVRLPSKQEIQLMVNGGCTFYQFDNIPYVYLLGLKTPEITIQLDDEICEKFICWFARFADLLVQTSYRQQWYKDIIMGFKLEQMQYIKSFFTILANLAFCIQKYSQQESMQLKGVFKELLQFEIDRDYKDELDSAAELDKLIKEFAEKDQQREQQQKQEQQGLSQSNPEDLTLNDESC